MPTIKLFSDSMNAEMWKKNGIIFNIFFLLSCHDVTQLEFFFLLCTKLTDWLTCDWPGPDPLVKPFSLVCGLGVSSLISQNTLSLDGSIIYSSIFDKTLQPAKITQVTCSWHQKRNSPIHEFKVLHKSQRAF